MEEIKKGSKVKSVAGGYLMEVEAIYDLEMGEKLVICCWIDEKENHRYENFKLSEIIQLTELKG